MWRAIPVRLGVGTDRVTTSKYASSQPGVLTYIASFMLNHCLMLCRCMKWVSRLVLAPLEQFGELSIPSDGLNFWHEKGTDSDRFVSEDWSTSCCQELPKEADSKRWALGPLLRVVNGGFSMLACQNAIHQCKNWLFVISWKLKSVTILTQVFWLNIVL